MFRKPLLAIALFLGLCAPALAQNVTCATRPPGDSSNACASTSFVQTAVGGGGSTALVIGSSTISGGTSGRVLYDNAGILGELAVTGTGSAVLATSPALLGSPTAPTQTTTDNTTKLATDAFVQSNLLFTQTGAAAVAQNLVNRALANPLYCTDFMTPTQQADGYSRTDSVDISAALQACVTAAETQVRSPILSDGKWHWAPASPSAPLTFDNNSPGAALNNAPLFMGYGASTVLDMSADTSFGYILFKASGGTGTGNNAKSSAYGGMAHMALITSIAAPSIQDGLANFFDAMNQQLFMDLHIQNLNTGNSSIAFQWNSVYSPTIIDVNGSSAAGVTALNDIFQVRDVSFGTFTGLGGSNAHTFLDITSGNNNGNSFYGIDCEVVVQCLAYSSANNNNTSFYGGTWSWNWGSTGANAVVASAGTDLGIFYPNQNANTTTGAAGNFISAGSITDAKLWNSSTLGGSGSGVTSVGLAEASTTPIFNISGSPVTSTGNLTETLKTQTANLIFSGPSSGSAAQPTFRSLVAADLPLATTGAFGAVKPDGSTITISAGVISSSGGGSGCTISGGTQFQVVAVNSAGTGCVPTANSAITSTSIEVGAGGNNGQISVGNDQVAGALTFQAATGSGINAQRILTAPMVTDTLAVLATAQTWGAIQTYPTSDIHILGSSTGSTALASANAGASNFTATIPAATDTIVELTQTQTLTNKTLTSPTLTTPALGTPASGVLTNATGLPIAGITGLGTGVATALAANLNGSGAITATTSPTFVTPVLGAATATSVNGLTLTALSTGFSVAGGTTSKTLTISNTLTLAGTDSTTMTFPASNGTIAALNIVDQTLTGGANVTPNAQATGSFTLDCGKSPLQWIADTGAFTITAPTTDGSCILQIEMGASAATPTFSGFTVGSNTGDAFTTTSGNKFKMYISRIHSVSSYTNQALQ